MKPKEISKKIQINKETVANLDESQLKDVKGGLFHDEPTHVIVSCAVECGPSV